MELNSGFRSLAGQLLSWAAIAGIAVMLMLNYDLVRQTMHAMFGAGLQKSASLGSPPPAPRKQKQKPMPDNTVELKASTNGHYQTRAYINGRSISVMVDTGASMVVLTHEDARTAGIYLKESDYTLGASTANGVTQVAPVTLDRISIGDITVRNVKAAVARQGRLQVTLLGMSFLSRLDRVDMRDGTLMLKD